jgi:hypothetical protein
MIGFLLDNIYVVFGDQVFQQSVGIFMDNNFAPLFVDLFLYSYEAEFAQKLLQDNNKNLPCPSTIHLVISMMPYPSTIIMLTVMST